MSRRYVHRVAGLAALLVATGSGAAQAAAATSDDGLWYYSQSGMEQLHQTTTGEGVTIAVLDTAINPDSPELAGADVQVHEPSYCATESGEPALPASGDGPTTQHGTSMTSLLVGSGERPDGKPGQRGVAPGATVRFYSIAPGGEDTLCGVPDTGADPEQAFRDAVADGADIINISMFTSIPPEDYAAAVRAGVVVVAAAGNSGGDLIATPADVNGVVAVGTVTPEVTLDPTSPAGPELGVVAPGSDFLCYEADLVTVGRCTGSSNAAAYTSGVLALAMSAFPEATTDQILQALVRTTDGQAVHEPQRDDAWGYGVVNARLLLETDPTTMPDVSPFVRDGADEDPTAAELTGAGGAAGSSPAPTDAGGAGETPAPAPEDDGTGASHLIIIGGVLGLLLVAGLVTAGVLAARRRKPVPDAGGPNSTAAPTYRGGPHG